MASINSIGRIAAIATLSVTAMGCNEGGPIYTLYRNSPLDLHMRVHWASFDAKESGNYNQENCNMAADLLNKNLSKENPENYPAVHFWCEKGEFLQ